MRTALHNSQTSYCPLCEGIGCLRLVADGIPILDCPVCHHRFAGCLTEGTHVDVVYGDEYFHGGGAGYPDYLADASLMRKHGQRYGKLLSRFHRPGRLLDIGAAAGFVLEGMTDTGWSGEGIEPNAKMAEYGRNQLGLSIRTGTLDTVGLLEPFDAISWIQVLAHFPDPLSTFRQADALTKIGGVWLIETWDCESLTAKLLGNSWHEYSPPSVLHWWSPPVLQRTLASLGYRLRGTGKPQKWIGLRHAKSLLMHKYGSGLAGGLLKYIPDGLAVPYPSEDLFWAVYEKCER